MLIFLVGLLKVFFFVKGDEIDGDCSLWVMKKCSIFRFLMEFYFCGVFEDGSMFISIIKDFVGSEYLRDCEVI